MHHLQSIQKALDWIEAHLTEELGLDTIARTAGMSHWHFQRTFSAMVGESVGGYIRRRRLTEAARSLRSNHSTILEIALNFQFESHEAFTRAFKSELQITPSAWRSNLDANVNLQPRIHVNAHSLEQRYRHMKLTPEIITLPGRTYIGMEAHFISATSPKANNMEVIPKLWDQFTRRISEIDSPESEAVYGLSDCLSGQKASRPDEAIYLASVLARDGAVAPQGMKSWKSPQGSFAKFIHRGRVEKIGETRDYIYAKWLPESDFERAAGPDIERCDSRFNPTSDDSVMEMFIPVQTKRD